MEGGRGGREGGRERGGEGGGFEVIESRDVHMCQSQAVTSEDKKHICTHTHALMDGWVGGGTW